MAKEEMYHHKGKGTGALIVGLLVLTNAYWNILGWAMFVGLILVIAGLVKLLMPKK